MRPNLFAHIGRHRALLLWMCLGTAFLLGCGSGADNLTASGGIGGTGVTIGEVSAFGSVFVNGVEFNTGEAELYMEGAYAGSGDQVVRNRLPIGQQVVIHGPFNDESSGTALQIDAYYRVQGPLQSIIPIDEDSMELVVMGQTVYVDRNTFKSGVTLETLTQDMLVRVSGPVDADGAVHAGRIALMVDTDAMGVKGRIEALDISRKIFKINDLNINYSALQMSPEILVNNGSIAVQGMLVDNELEASWVEPFQTESIESADEFLIDGFITGLDTANQWRMGDYEIRLGSGTRFEGLTPDDITAGVRVKVKGRLQNRLVQVERVEASTNIRLESIVAAVDNEDSTLTLAGMNAISIHTNRLTRFHGSMGGGMGDSISIAPGDQVRVHAYTNDEQTVVATAIFKNEPNPQNNRFVLQGPVTSITGVRFAILGVDIAPDANAGVTFWITDTHPVTAEEFQSALREDILVRVSGRWVGADLIYETMEITDSDRSSEGGE